jgi:hypothetical protein
MKVKNISHRAHVIGYGESHAIHTLMPGQELEMHEDAAEAAKELIAAGQLELVVESSKSEPKKEMPAPKNGKRGKKQEEPLDE